MLVLTKNSPQVPMLNGGSRISVQGFLLLDLAGWAAGPDYEESSYYPGPHNPRMRYASALIQSHLKPVYEHSITGRDCSFIETGVMVRTKQGRI